MQVMRQCYGAWLLLCALPPGAAADTWSQAEIRDRMMIEETMNRYLYALDTVDPEGYANTFTEDGVLIVRETDAADDYTERGREEIRAYGVKLRETWGMPPYGGGGPRFGPLRHVYYNFLITGIDAERARVETYWTTRARNPAGGPAVIASMGRSEDLFVKQDGRWLIKERVIIVDMDTPPAAD